MEVLEQLKSKELLYKEGWARPTQAATESQRQVFVYLLGEGTSVESE